MSGLNVEFGVAHVGRGLIHLIVEARKLEHCFRRISARIPYTLPYGHEDNDVPTFWLLLYQGPTLLPTQA